MLKKYLMYLREFKYYKRDINNSKGKGHGICFQEPTTFSTITLLFMYVCMNVLCMYVCMYLVYLVCMF